MKRVLFIIIITTIVSVVGSSHAAQNQSRGSTVLSIIVLPMRSSQNLPEIKEHFIDEFIRTLKVRGHNAISTRYLGTALQDSRFVPLEACTTSLCMSQLVQLVGTRFLIHGSFESDSSVQVIELHVIDVPDNKEIAFHKETFIGDNNSIDLFVPEFTDRILKSILINMSNETIRIPITDTVSELSASDSRENSVSDSSVTSVNDSTIGGSVVAFLELPSDSDTTVSSGTVTEAIAAVPESQSGESLELTTVEASEVRTRIDSTSAIQTDMWVLDTTPVERNDNTLVIQSHAQQKTEVGDSVSIQSSLVDSNKHSIASQNLLSKSTIEPSKTRSLPKGRFRLVRLSGFGIAAAGGIIGGITFNHSVRRSLEKEDQFFAEYMKAAKNQTDQTYRKYVNQTHRTDKYAGRRAISYIVGGAALAGLSISIFF